MKQIKFTKNQSHFFIIFFSFFILCSFDNYEEEIYKEAVQQGDIEKVRDFIEAGVDVKNIKDDIGNTLLHVATSGCANGVKEMVGELIGAGIKVDEGNKAKQTPLHKAAWSGCTKAVEALIEEHNAVVDAEAMFGFSPAHEAARKGHIEVLRILGQASADLSAQDKAGNSPAHWLVWNRHKEGIQVLKLFEASLNIINDYGDSPFSIAFNRQDEEMILVLEEEPASSAALLEIDYPTE